MNRALQLDSLALDNEIASMLATSLSQLLQQFEIYRWLPEDISQVIYSLMSVLRLGFRGQTVGMAMYGLSLQKSALLVARLTLAVLLSLQKLDSMNYMTRTGLKYAKLVNLLMFLRSGRFPTLAHRLTMTGLGKEASDRVLTIDEGFMGKQLLWQQLASLVHESMPLIAIGTRLVKERMTALKGYHIKGRISLDSIGLVNGRCPKCQLADVLVWQPCEHFQMCRWCFPEARYAKCPDCAQKVTN